MLAVYREPLTKMNIDFRWPARHNEARAEVDYADREEPQRYLQRRIDRMLQIIPEWLRQQTQCGHAIYHMPCHCYY